MPEAVRMKGTARIDSLRSRSEWEFSDTLRTVQTTDDIPVVFWSVDISRDGVPVEVHRIPRADGMTPKLQQRANAEYMNAVQEETKRYVYYDIKSFILSKVAEL